MPDTAERLAVLETEMRQVSKHQQQFSANWVEVNQKLDSIISLRDKGIGAFWLASALTGTGIIGIFLSIVEYFKG